MGALKDSSPYWKKFLNGDFGHAHAAQEFSVWAVLMGVGGWFIGVGPMLVVAVALMIYADKYWINREIRQSKDMGRKELTPGEMPKHPDSFWTQDAIDDVMFPRKMRIVWVVLTGLWFMWLAQQVGMLAPWFEWQLCSINLCISA